MTALEKENRGLRQEVYVLKERIAQLERLLFSSKRERYIPAKSPQQGVLFEQADIEVQQEVSVELPASQPAKKQQKSRKGIKRNTFPASLVRQEVVITPDLEGLENPVKVGEDITEVLAFQPATVYVKKIVRPRYADQADPDKGIKQEPIPPRLIPGGMVDASLIAQIIIEKILYHMPVYRFAKKLKALGIDFIKQNNLHNWLHRGAHSLLPLYYLLQKEVLESGYVQADESHIKVLAKNKKNASHRGQMWVYLAPSIKATFFNYEPTRSGQAADEILSDYSGVLQSDGYSVYEAIGKRKGVQLIHCMAHARRKFFEAKENEPQMAGYFIKALQTLYEIEEEARKDQLNFEQRLELRQKKALPILEELGEWLLEKSADRTILPKSMIRKAIDYSLALWKGLCAYAHNGEMEIDNNLVENTIRPLALGRKNYLFAGSHNAAQNLAILYSIAATCEKNDINPLKYFNWILKKVATEKITDEAAGWLPHRVKKETLDEFWEKTR